MTNHTPGPWYVVRTLTSSLSIAASPKYTLIATVYGAAFHAGPYVAEANARLIAAAPDMLEALRTIVEYGPQSGMKADAPMLIAARAAIAKAEDRS